jgi:hypothetical protein
VDRALRRRRGLFRRVVVVFRFAVAIAAAGREGRDSSHGDIEALQTITERKRCSDETRQQRPTVGMKMWAGKPSLSRAGWVDGYE